MIQPTDILIRKDGGQETTWISDRLLNELFNISTYLRTKGRFTFNQSVPAAKRNQNIKPDTGKSWRWAKIEGQYYYDYNRIPDRAPACYQSNLPLQKDLVQTRHALSQQQTNNFAQQFIEAISSDTFANIDSSDIQYFIYKAAVKFSPANAQQLSQARAWLNTIKTWFEKKKYKNYNLSANEYWQRLSTHIREMDLYGLNTDTPGSLRKKALYEFPEGREPQLEALVSKKHGNQYARVVGKNKITNLETGEIMKFDIHEALIYNAWMNPGKANKLHKTGEVSVYKDYEKTIREYGFDPVNESTVAFYLRKFPNRAMMSLERDGHDHFTNKYKPYIPTFKPQYSGSIWVADYSGTKMLYKYRKTGWNKAGTKKVDKWVSGSGYLLRITDSATDYIAGWHFIESGEEWKSLLPALNMAIKNNDGHAARELVTDNGPAFTSTEGKSRLAMLFDKHRRIQKGNKQANKAETYVRLLSDKARQFDNWSMLGFHSTHEDNQANPDYLEFNNLPTQGRVLMQIEELIEQWNTSPRPDGTIPVEEFNKQSRRNPDLKPVNIHTHRFVFGNHSNYTLDRCRGLMQLRNGPEIHEFEFANWEDDAVLNFDRLDPVAFHYWF